LFGSPAEAQMLEQENERLMEQLNSLTNAVDQVRSPMILLCRETTFRNTVCVNKISAQSPGSHSKLNLIEFVISLDVLLTDFWTMDKPDWLPPPPPMHFLYVYRLRYGIWYRSD
jgi:hypothetical protein